MKVVTLDKNSATADMLPSGNMEHIWRIFRDIRTCRALLGLRAGHLHTLQAMISILRPGKGLIVFASNQTLCERAGQIDERTLRRHIARLEKSGLLFRQDSPNRKRYRISDPSGGGSEAYGLSLQPMVNAAALYDAQATQIEQDRQRCRFLRKRLLRLLFDLEQTDSQYNLLAAFRRALRRKLTSFDYEAMIGEIAELLNTTPNQPSQVPSGSPQETDVLTANAGHIDRHLSTSEKKDIDLEESAQNKSAGKKIGKAPTPTANLLRKVKAVCTEAFSFTQEPPNDWNGLHTHAQMLAPMMGIAPKALQAAREKLGCEGTTLTVLLVLQLQPKIRNLQAYFHSITIGRRSHGFDPIRLLNQVSA